MVACDSGFLISCGVGRCVVQVASVVWGAGGFAGFGTSLWRGISAWRFWVVWLMLVVLCLGLVGCVGLCWLWDSFLVLDSVGGWDLV